MATVDSNIRARTKPYSDFAFVFKKHPVTKAVPINRDVEAVKQSVRNILLTRRGEIAPHLARRTELFCTLYQKL